MYMIESACRIQIDAQAGGELVEIAPSVLGDMSNVIRAATAGQGAALAWPALLRKLDRTDPSYKS
jgi:hypothetical protein